MKDRTTNIIDAGQSLFLNNGLRGTSMEAIAREAGVAKPTLYKYFPSKEAVFAAAVSRLLTQMRQLATDALESEGDVESRVARALSDTSKAVFRLLDGSPHGEQLYGERIQLAADEVRKYKVWIETAIADALAEAGRAEPHKLAKLLIACSDGISRHVRFAEQIGPAIRLVTLKLLA